MPAVAITDSNNLFAALEFSVLMGQAGIQPIVGCQLTTAYCKPVTPDKPAPSAPLVLLAQSEIGYRNLLKLNSRLYLREDEGGAQHRIILDELAQHSDGLVCLSGGPAGPVGRLLQAGRRPAAEAFVGCLADAFPGRLYIELQRHFGESGQPHPERLIEQGQVEIAYAMDLPLVATNDVYFPTVDMYEAHDALICIADGTYVYQQKPRRRFTPQHYFKSQREMTELFADLPEAVENTVEIARRCAFMASRRDPILPKFAEDEVQELRRQARSGLAVRLSAGQRSAPEATYYQRLDYELGVIERMGFPGYFLIVADFIKWAKENGIPVGPGRGSGAGSLVAYALTITDLDPLRYSLLFERFLNPDRISMPDFDIDFCMDRRAEVIQYVQEKYGRGRVGQIITFGALLSKAAVRDIGRVLQLPYGQVDRLAKMIPFKGVRPVTVKEALEEEPRLGEEAAKEEVVGRLLGYAGQVEGLLRNASTHAAGVVIADQTLDQLVPLYRDPRSDMPATQFNMKWVEQAGLVKFDFLGLKTLTAIQNTVDLVVKGGRDLHVAADGRQLYDPPANAVNDIGAIPLDDQATFDLYSSARTAAVFQVESTGMMDALKRMRPNCIEDIVALVALYRPGPMENIPTYCEVKNGLRERESIHPLIDDILEETQGIIVYQEQVMQIAQVMAGYTLGGADLLRRAMGKKDQKAMAEERPKFEAGAVANGVSETKAAEVFNLLEKFAEYGFNKSHAAAYAMVSYQTAWLKANHPVESMAGVMNCDIYFTDKLAAYFDEVKTGLGLRYELPCVNRSDAMFVVRRGILHYALAALKNVGVDAMRLIVEARHVDGGERPFVSLFDFARRVNLRRVGKRSLEVLACAGAFDQLDSNRKRVFQGLEALTEYSAAVFEQRESGQYSLFGDSGEDLPEPRFPSVEDWRPAERLDKEADAVGFFLSGHPLEDYMVALRRKGILTCVEITGKASSHAYIGTMAGRVSSRSDRMSAKGKRFAFVQLSDISGTYEVTVFSDTLEMSRDLLESGSLVVLKVEASAEDGQVRFLARSVTPVEKVVAEAGTSELMVYIGESGAVAQVASVLRQAVANVSGGEGPVRFSLKTSDLPGDVEVDLGRKFPINPQIKGALKSLNGVLQVEER